MNEKTAALRKRQRHCKEQNGQSLKANNGPWKRGLK